VGGWYSDELLGQIDKLSLVFYCVHSNIYVGNW
jgi:hypothetical protein